VIEASRPLQIASVADRAYLSLRERILAGDLPPDARLHQEDLSRELGVSRTPVREALGRLAAEGLVELLPNRGARVAEVGLADMEAAYQARLIVEPPAAALAAQHAGAEDVAAMREAIAAHRAHVGEVTAAFTANRAFHLALIAASGNLHLTRFAESLWPGASGCGCTSCRATARSPSTPTSTRRSPTRWRRATPRSPSVWCVSTSAAPWRHS
jgi:DNA-binding GntR family transcriptional regulator